MKDETLRKIMASMAAMSSYERITYLHDALQSGDITKEQFMKYATLPERPRLRLVKP